MNLEELATAATAALAADPQAARAFDAAAGSNAASRRAFVAATLRAAQARKAENDALRARHNAARERIQALKVAAALRPSAAPQAATLSAGTKPAATQKPARDLRQGDLSLDRWALEHVFRAALRGDIEARGEITRRGFQIHGETLSRSLKS